MFFANITSEQIAELPLLELPVPIALIERPEEVAPAIERINREAVIGLDTETRPSFKKGVRYKVSLLQIATPYEVFLFRLHHTGCPPELLNVLGNPNILKVGVALSGDIRELSRGDSFVPQGWWDIQSYTEDYGIEAKSLKKLTAIVLRKRISKRQQTSNWESPNLSSAQQVYAATDAWVCREIYFQLTGNAQMHK